VSQRRVLVLLCAGWLPVAAGCRGGAAAPPPVPVPVVAEVAARRSLPLELRAIGSVESPQSVAVKPLVAGVLTVVHFREGSDVARGETLFTVDPRPYEAALRQAEAALVRDQASARNARLEAGRAQALFEQGVLSRELYEERHSAAEALDSGVGADRAVADAARLNLENCTIRSPLAGRSGSLLVHAGNVVKASDAEPLVVINRIDPVYVSFAVPEKRLAELTAARAAGRLAVQARVPGDARPPLAGELSFLDNGVDRTTGTLRLKGTFANRERRLWPGQFVDVSLALGTLKDALVVPAPAIQAGQAGAFVFVVKADHSVEVRNVAVGPELGGVVVVERGLREGESVVTDGQIRLVPGARVELKAPVGAPPSGARP
jgi:multidrug efflux system membrane fusion protein